MINKLLTVVLFIVLCSPLSVLGQTGSLTGQVSDSQTEETLPGATIVLQGTSLGASTNIDGVYSLENIPVGDYTVRVSFVGYRTFNRQVTISANERQTLDIALAPDYVGLDDVVVVGYGTRDRRDITGSVASVSGEEIARLPISNIESALSGRAAGVQVTGASGLPGGEVTIRIRGNSSIGAGNQPLYVVDGMPITTASTATSLAGNAGEHTTSALADLNANDIESMEVLKDASATAIYGSRAANGVVIITTKRGRAAQTEVSVGQRFGTVQETGRLDMLNGSQFVEITQEANTAGSQNYPDAGSAGNYNWTDAVHQTGFISQSDVSIRGGDERTRFYVGGSYQDQEGYLIENRFRNASGRINLDHTINDRMRIGSSLAINRLNNDRVGSDNLVMGLITSSALNAPIRPIYLEDGSFNTTHLFTDNEGNIIRNPNTGNPYTVSGNIAFNTVQEATTNTRNLKSFRTIGNTFFEVDLMEGLEYRGSIAIDYSTNENFTRYLSTTGSGAPDGSGTRRSEQTINWLAENLLTYRTTIDDVHNLNVIGLLSYQTNRREGIFVGATGFPSDLFPNVASASEPTSTSAYADIQWGLESYMTRLSYNYDRKYYLEFTTRVDGSSRFGADNQYGFFPAGAVSWNVAREDFMQDVNLINDLRIRVSYGILGNDNIGNFASRGLWSGNANYAGAPGLSPAQIQSPQLKWEQTDQLDIGIDVTLLDERVSIVADYYNKYTKDMLLPVQLPWTTGFSSVNDNVGEMRNRGFEFGLTTQNLTGDFRWSTSFNITFNKNEVVKLDGDDAILGTQGQRAEEGYALGTFFIPVWAGVDSETGLPQWEVVDDNGDVSLTNLYGEATRQYVGDVQPDYFGGFTNNFSYKGLDLNVFFQYVQGNKLYWQSGTFLLNPGSNFNKSTDILDRWQQPGDVTDVPRFFAEDGTRIASTGQSTRFLQDGSYIRLKDVTLSYTLPRDIVSQIGLSRANVFVQGTNLLTITDYQGLDPEVSNQGTSTLGAGVDFFTPPQARTFMAGFNVTF